MLPEHVHRIQVVGGLQRHEPLVQLVLDMISASGMDSNKDEIFHLTLASLACLPRQVLSFDDPQS